MKENIERIRKVLEDTRRSFDKGELSIDRMKSLYRGVCEITTILEISEKEPDLLKMAYNLGSDLYFTVSIHEREAGE